MFPSLSKTVLMFSMINLNFESNISNFNKWGNDVSLIGTLLTNQWTIVPFAMLMAIS